LRFRLFGDQPIVNAAIISRVVMQLKARAAVGHQRAPREGYRDRIAATSVDGGHSKDHVITKPKARRSTTGTPRMIRTSRRNDDIAALRPPQSQLLTHALRDVS